MDMILYKKAESTNECTGVFIEKNGKILSGLRNYSKENCVWTVPGGRCDIGEEIKNSLIREVQEETGITDLTITKFLGTIPGAKQGDMFHLFVGTTNQEPILMEPEKFSEWKWFLVSEIPNNFINMLAIKLYTENNFK